MDGFLPHTAITPLVGNQTSGIQCFMGRLDLIHPIVSGNKLFKLWYYLEKFQMGSYQGLLTMGGAYSNHLLATAYACRQRGITCYGIVRGEAPAMPGPTLHDCEAYGMQLSFVSRQRYRDLEATLAAWLGEHASGGPYLVVPEGGAGEEGIRGAALISQSIPDFEAYTHILCATGTGTTLKGIDRTLYPGQSAIGISVVEIPFPAQASFCQQLACSPQTSVLFQYAFGGYARQAPELIRFIQSFYDVHGIVTDFVYTAKAAFALEDLAAHRHFPTGSRVLLLHTGGLQGNRSLPYFC